MTALAGTGAFWQPSFGAAAGGSRLAHAPFAPQGSSRTQSEPTGTILTDTPDEDALLQSYAAGAPEAAVRLTRSVTPRVYAHAYRLLGSEAEAEDVTQEVMIRLFRIAADWRSGEAKVSTWTYRVTANLCTDQLRKRRSVGLDDVEEPPDPAPSAPRQLQEKARADALQGALMTLPERQREAVVLRHIEGLSNPEIARIMDIGPRAVESLTARGKRALAGLLAPMRDALGYDDDKT